MERRWILPGPLDADASRQLAREQHLPAFVADHLIASGLCESAAATAFLEPRLRTLSDPTLIPGIADAIERIGASLRAKQRIVLYGDYDVDGIASLALLHRVLRAHGADVQSFLPLRAAEGYGLSSAGLDRCVELHSPELLIAIDCGTNSTAEIAALRARGIDVIVLDHHEADASNARDAGAILVNPKLGDGAYAYLCSVGVVFKVAHALLKTTPLPGFDLRDTLDLVALATICDLVPLIGENRILVRAGLEQMARTRWPGLASLLAVSGIATPVRASDVGFRVGPRINAAGRLGPAQDALNLLLTDDPEEAVQLAARLDVQNRDRQNVERAVALEVEAWVAAHYDGTRDASIVAGARGWHQGVLGIVASRISRRHHRPTLIVGFDATGQGKGSGRSIEGLSIVEALRRCESHLGNFGGHEMAAGLNVHEDAFLDFRAAFEQATRDLVTDDMLVPRLHLNAEISLAEFGPKLLEAQQMLEPFGTGNRQPLLFVRRVSPAAEPRVLKEKHLRLSFPGGGRQTVTAIYFNGAEQPLPPPPWDVAFHLERNAYNGRVEVQMQVVAIRSAA